MTLTINLYQFIIGTAAWAAELDAAVWTVTAFEALAADMARQTLPQLAEDGEDEEPSLLATLTATAYRVEVDDAQTIFIAVTWVSEPDFDQTVPSDYIYTPELPGGIHPGGGRGAARHHRDGGGRARSAGRAASGHAG